MPGQVMVACCMPNGVRLHIDDFREFPEQVVGGGTRMVRRGYRRNQADVVLKGSSVPYGTTPGHTIIGTKAKYGLTPNVDADFFAEWMKQNADSDLVKNHIVFAAGKTETVVDMTKDHKNTLSGLERLNPETKFNEGTETPVDARWPKKIQTAKKGQIE